MKIKHVHVWTADLGNKRPYTIAFKHIDEVFNVFAEITLSNGISGLGSGNPSEYVTGESFSSCVTALHADNLEFLSGRDILELHQLLFEIQHRFPNNPAARAALDIALYDAFTQHLGIPLVTFLGRKHQALPTSVTVGIKGVPETLQDATEFIQQGFFILKIKLGKNLEEDVERLRKVREKYSDVVIRVDANQGYTAEETITFYKETKHLNIELIEQPVVAAATHMLRKLPQEIRKHVVADESLLTINDAMALATDPPAAHIFNIKLMKCGGIFPALKIADVAYAAHIDLFWGCNDESIISIAAALHTAYACPHTKYLDLDGSLDLTNDIVKGGFVLKQGIMHTTEASGLGVIRD